MADEIKSFAEMIASASPQKIAALLRDPRFDESHALQLLSRNELPTSLLDEIGRRRELLKSPRVAYALAGHPRSPHALALRALRNIYAMDLVKLSLAPVVAPGIRAAAEDAIIARLPQIPLGQKISLARQAPARVLGELVTLGNARFVDIALESPRLTEAAVLKVLAKENLSDGTVTSIANHARWARSPNVRVALLRRAEISAGVRKRAVEDAEG